MASPSSSSAATRARPVSPTRALRSRNFFRAPSKIAPPNELRACRLALPIVEKTRKTGDFLPSLVVSGGTTMVDLPPWERPPSDTTHELEKHSTNYERQCNVNRPRASLDRHPTSLHATWRSPVRHHHVGEARCAHRQLEDRQRRLRAARRRVPRVVVAERHQHRRAEIFPRHSWYT